MRRFNFGVCVLCFVVTETQNLGQCSVKPMEKIFVLNLSTILAQVLSIKDGVSLLLLESRFGFIIQGIIEVSELYIFLVIYPFSGFAQKVYIQYVDLTQFETRARKSSLANFFLFLFLFVI